MRVPALIIALGMLLVLALPASALQYDAPKVSRSGVIHSIDISRNEIIIEGHRYQVSQTADVEIGGSYGAYTMLQRGMRVYFEYRRYDDGRREIFTVKQLLGGEELEQA